MGDRVMSRAWTTVAAGLTAAVVAVGTSVGWPESSFGYEPGLEQDSTASYLFSVSANATDDVWAVGYTRQDSVWTTFTEHWDGEDWTVVNSPNRSPTHYELLTSVAAISPTDVWAVGLYQTRRIGYYHSLTLHWDGHAWSDVHSPSGRLFTALNGVDAAASDDVWAVGVARHLGKGYRSLFEHWDGASWSVVHGKRPRLRTFGVQAVGVVSHDDVWAVTERRGMYHYDGTWHRFHHHGLAGDGLDLSMDSATDGWTVDGHAVQHWDGSTWNSMQVKVAYLYGVDADAPDDAWAVGSNDAQHWDGTAWSSFQDGVAEYQAVEIISPDDVWAVGYVLNVGAAIEHWDGTAWSDVS